MEEIQAHVLIDCLEQLMNDGIPRRSNGRVERPLALVHEL